MRPYDQERNYDRDVKATIMMKNVALTFLSVALTIVCVLGIVTWFFLAPRYLTR